MGKPGILKLLEQNHISVTLASSVGGPQNLSSVRFLGKVINLIKSYKINEQHVLRRHLSFSGEEAEKSYSEPASERESTAVRSLFSHTETQDPSLAQRMVP